MRGLPRPDELPELPAAWLAALRAPGGDDRPRRARRRPATTARVVQSPHDVLEVLGRDGVHHPDWIVAKLADELRQLGGEAALHHAAAAGFLVAQTAALGLADDATDRLAAALARHPHRPELVDAAKAGHARARTVRWALAGMASAKS